MAQLAETRRLTEREYLAFERQSHQKHEFFDGEVFAMAGGSLEHSLIAANTITVLNSALKGRCRVFTSDLRIKVEATGLLTYPDFSIVYGSASFATQERDVLTNPILIGEVLSDSTEGYDRGTKFRNYQLIPSLRAFLLITQTSARVELYSRQSDFIWEYREVRGLDGSLEIAALKETIKLRDIYQSVEFAARPLR